MPRTPSFKIIPTPKGFMISVPPSMTASGKRVRKYFPTTTEAKKFSAKLMASYRAGHRSGIISTSLAVEAKEAASILEGTGISLVEAARIARTTAKGKADKETFHGRYCRAVDAMEGHWSHRYYLEVSKMLKWLPKEFQKIPCWQINADMAKEAIQGHGKFAQSTLERRTTLVMAIVHYKERHRKKTTIHILDKDQRKALFDACQTAQERWVVALLLYAGIRPDSEHGEISRMDWSDVRESHIYVSEEASKTNTDRLIPIAPILAELLADRPEKGRILPPRWKIAWTRIRKEAGISHLQDVLRHTYASHMLMWKGEEATKAAMGHTANSSTLFRHYRRAVSREDAVAFFCDSLNH